MLQGLIDAHGQFKMTLGEADKEYEALLNLHHQVIDLAQEYNVPGATENPYTDINPEVSFVLFCFVQHMYENSAELHFKQLMFNMTKAFVSACSSLQFL